MAWLYLISGIYFIAQTLSYMIDVKQFLVEMGRKLRQHRESIGKSVELVALDCDLPTSGIQAIEDGEDAEFFTYVELLDYYELPRNFLFD